MEMSRNWIPFVFLLSDNCARCNVDYWRIIQGNFLTIHLDSLQVLLWTFDPERHEVSGPIPLLLPQYNSPWNGHSWHFCHSWCFRPLFIWMRILGIDLYPISRKSIRRYGLVMLLMGTWAEIELIFDVFRKLLSLKLASSTTTNWNIAIDYINNSSFVVFVSLIIFYVARNRWQLLWDSILKFESNCACALSTRRELPSCQKTSNSLVVSLVNGLKWTFFFFTFYKSALLRATN